MPSTSISSSACRTCAALGFQRCCSPTVLVAPESTTSRTGSGHCSGMARVDVADGRAQLAHVDLAERAAEHAHLAGGRMLERAEQP